MTLTQQVLMLKMQLAEDIKTSVDAKKIADALQTSLAHDIKSSTKKELKAA